jgi:coniferyl-aldehyde dehydrogenase
VWVPMSPLGGIFAAGNLCMIKLSELTPATSALLEKLISQYFSEEELVAINGDASVAESFSRLPFDHLLFTGATSVGKLVMKAAAENLVPVTLELGGKSPVVIGRSANLKQAARKIAAGKALNMGQVCTSPDYILVKNDSLNELIAELENAFTDMFPTILRNPDYTAVVNERHYQRLQRYIEDAKQKNGEIRVINPAREHFEHQQGTYKIPPTLVINPTPDMLLMQEEIFGPIIPVVGVGHVDDAIDYINDRPRPLALYLFASQQKEMDRILSHTISGGVTVNDVIQHVGCEDLPFGGIGASGMGSYHAHEGFKTFSHARSVYTQARINMMALMGMMPPYKSEKVNKILDSMIKK